MGRLFIFIFLAITVLFVSVFLIAKKLIGGYDSENNFSSPRERPASGYDEYMSAPGEYESYVAKEHSVIMSMLRKAPLTIMNTIIIQFALMAFTGYLSVHNIERLAMAGSALTQGQYGLAISALWPIGKESAQYRLRVARGVHPYLNEKDLDNFIYIGKLDGKNVAIMESLYQTQDHDRNLTKKSASYGTAIIGLKATKAESICEEKYDAKLISFAEWSLARGHFLARRNIREYNIIPEWTRDISENDSDNYGVIAKKSDVKRYASSKGFDTDDSVNYIDDDDLDIAGFRCSITWEESDAGKN